MAQSRDLDPSRNINVKSMLKCLWIKEPYPIDLICQFPLYSASRRRIYPFKHLHRVKKAQLRHYYSVWPLKLMQQYITYLRGEQRTKDAYWVSLLNNVARINLYQTTLAVRSFLHSPIASMSLLVNNIAVMFPAFSFLKFWQSANTYD